MNKLIFMFLTLFAINVNGMNNFGIKMGLRNDNYNSGTNINMQGGLIWKINFYEVNPIFIAGPNEFSFSLNNNINFFDRDNLRQYINVEIGYGFTSFYGHYEEARGYKLGLYYGINKRIINNVELYGELGTTCFTDWINYSVKPLIISSGLILTIH